MCITVPPSSSSPSLMGAASPYALKTTHPVLFPTHLGSVITHIGQGLANDRTMGVWNNYSAVEQTPR